MTTKHIIALVALAIIGFGAYTLTTHQSTQNRLSSEMKENADARLPIIHPVSHASFVMEWEGETIYNDPVGEPALYETYPAADIILLSDIHGDHLNVDTLEAVVGEAAIIAPQAVFDELPTALQAVTQVVANNETVTLGAFELTAVPMYNLPDQGVDIRHEEGRGNGYVVEAAGTRVYIAGDTADIPEMRALTDIDTAFVPMNLPYTMSVEDAADGVIAFAPRQVIPYHYRTPEGFSDIAKFKELVNASNPDIEVTFLPWYGLATPVTEYDIDENDFVDGEELIGNLPMQSNLSSQERAGLVLMREEEKLARDVYTTLAEQWNLPIFSNIARSEQTHMDAMAVLLERYDVSDPVSKDETGVFTDPQLQTLYTELVTKGSESRTDALKVGATVEDLDIYDLERLMMETDREDIRVTYANLQKGSRNHLRAFNRQIERQGAAYTPQFISQDTFDAIINSAQEKGVWHGDINLLGIYINSGMLEGGL